MSFKGQVSDYEPITRPSATAEWKRDDPVWPERAAAPVSAETGEMLPESSVAPVAAPKPPLKRGHMLSFAGLFLFTVLLYFRPYELYPSLGWLSTIPFWLAAATILVFLPSQFALEGTLTMRPREVSLVLLFSALALLSILFAIDRGLAWEMFSGIFLKVVVMFIVFVNVVRTERRLRLMLLLALAAGFVISFSAINSYLAGNFNVEGYRVEGGIRLSGLFGSTNDMALFLVTLIPIAVALFCRTRNVLGKAVYGGMILLMLAGTLVTYSRGGFLGLLGMALVLAWKLGRRHRLAVVVSLVLCCGALLALAPENYSSRIASITNSSGPRGEASATQRRALLTKSISVALHNPVFGVGMANFPIVSYRNLVTHNAYTQVASEMGLIALAVYLLIMLTPLKGLRKLERETLGQAHERRVYYLAVGLQAALVGYMVSSFFLSVAYGWTIYYLVGYAVCLRRLHESRQGAEAGAPVTTG
ncbi:MAG TPA: O-antigen ligase family protein [Pyrinomonadaceae bacterium]|nr:O-antigen ligase family protein [Pyrinomonadaceae bacterium]